MTNEQLAVLLHNLAQKIESSVDSVRAALPDEFKHVTKNIFEQSIESCQILDPLYDIVRSLHEDVDVLTEKK